MGRKRHLSVFDAIEDFDAQDRNAERKRRKETSAEKKRALEAQSQTKIYNHLLEIRILLQRAVNKVNYASETGNDSLLPELSSKKSAFRDTCDALLRNLLQARSQLYGSSETRRNEYKDHFMSSTTTASDLQSTLQDEYEKHREDWKNIFNRRHKNLKLHAGVTAKSQFRIMDSSFWEQVEATMEYEEIRRTDEKSTKPMLFDDSKVYQQLLKDFVANSANSSTRADGSTDHHQPSKRYKNDQNNKKKDVDRRASKGRKIRYKEIPKLVNFTFPLSRLNTSNLNREEYFKSLFGGAGNASN